MVILDILRIIVFLLNPLFCSKLATDPNTYVNLESAVNPDYYKNNSIYRSDEYDGKAIHIKMGLSKPKEKLLYQKWFAANINKFASLIINYVCPRGPYCKNKKNLIKLLFQLKKEKNIIKENLMSEFQDDIYLKVSNKAIEIFDKYFDKGYCGYTIASNITLTFQNFNELNQIDDVKKFSTLIDTLVRIFKEISKFETLCY